MAEEMKICAIGKKECTDENPCELHEEYTELRDHVQKYFEKVNLSTFTEVSQEKKKNG
jgi:DNA-binding IscR family transcriptional regulator